MSLKGFFKNNYYPRYSNQYGMELYSFPVDFQSNKLGYPYGDYSKGLFRPGRYKLDNNGVFVFIDKNSNIYYNPCGIAEYALVCWTNMLRNGDNNENHLIAFYNQITWLVENVTYIEYDKAVWYYNYPNKDNFFSGIAQGMIISVFLRAYQLKNDPYYFQLAKHAYNFLNTKIADGGVLYTKPPFNWWYEEYLKSPKILNGHIYALLGIWDLYRVTRDDAIKKTFFKGLKDIKDNIKKFDLGFFTKYDALSRYPANNSYHYTHINLFYILYTITEDVFFKNYAIKFNGYYKNFFYKTLNLFYLFFLVIIDKLRKK